MHWNWKRIDHEFLRFWELLKKYLKASEVLTLEKYKKFSIYLVFLVFVLIKPKFFYMSDILHTSRGNFII